MQIGRDNHDARESVNTVYSTGMHLYDRVAHAHSGSEYIQSITTIIRACGSGSRSNTVGGTHAVCTQVISHAPPSTRTPSGLVPS